MRRRRQQSRQIEPTLFPLPSPVQSEPALKRIQRPIWTENKAKLIERYLYYFVLITKHGTYIDGFAGPQAPDKTDSWAAKLVLESEPRRLRNFYLFDESKRQARRLEKMIAGVPDTAGRSIKVFNLDFNKGVRKLLASGVIGAKEATFCLLDQRTFECHWSTLEALAKYKPEGFKIELFYFLPEAWLDRALAAQRQTKILRAWWGRDDWAILRGKDGPTRARAFEARLRTELGYASAKAWPIYKQARGRTVMYYMIHATDHAEAPKQMYRAYYDAVLPREQAKQLWLSNEFHSPDDST